MMDNFKIMKARHSIRNYNDRKIEKEVATQLQAVIDQCNQESGLHIQLCLDEPDAFDSVMARYGKFTNVKNYIAIVGKKADDLHEKAGYYGEKVVLEATKLGLGTCWVAMTYSKSKSRCRVDNGEKLVIVISLGYFDKDGIARKTKSVEELSQVNGTMPAWFRHGIEAAQLAPTAINQQKFLFSLHENTVSVKAGKGFYTKIDLGIVKYHFELGAKNANWKWEK